MSDHEELVAAVHTARRHLARRLRGVSDAAQHAQAEVYRLGDAEQAAGWAQPHAAGIQQHLDTIVAAVAAAKHHLPGGTS